MLKRSSIKDTETEMRKLLFIALATLWGCGDDTLVNIEPTKEWRDHVGFIIETSTVTGYEIKIETFPGGTQCFYGDWLAPSWVHGNYVGAEIDSVRLTYKDNYAGYLGATDIILRIRGERVVKDSLRGGLVPETMLKWDNPIGEETYSLTAVILP